MKSYESTHKHEIDNILKKNIIEDLEKFIKRRSCLNNFNTYFIYIYFIFYIYLECLLLHYQQVIITKNYYGLE